MTSSHIAVIDIGKTNAKLALVDLTDLSEIAVVTRPNEVLPGHPYPHFDVDGHWSFLLENLAIFQTKFGIDALVVTTHGAAAALMGEDGELATAIIDYEYTGPEKLTAEYDAIRPPFSETGSPRLAMGLNVGAQIHYQFATQPGLREATQTIVTYPQYWAMRFTGVAATDYTSLGAHTDLWNPYEKHFSSLVDRLGISEKLAAPRPCEHVLGPVLPQISARTGLPRDTPVYCGIHDSNASLLGHLKSRKAPFSVVSTGTWVIAMAVGGKPAALDPARDTLVNVNAFAEPVPSARFMGGREHDLATKGAYPDPADGDFERALKSGVMLLPSLMPEIGPFIGSKARWVGAEPAIGTVERGICTGFYLALVTAQCLDLIGHDGTIIVEGPFAANGSFSHMLAAATNCSVEVSDSATGTSQGAAMLAMMEADRPKFSPVRQLLPSRTTELMAEYAHAWKAVVQA